MIPVEFAQNNIFCEKPVFKHVEMAKDGAVMAKEGHCHAIFKNQVFHKKYYFVQTLQASLIIYANYSFRVEPHFKVNLFTASI